MQEKFMKLSVGVRWAIVGLLWLVTAVGFVGCLMVKQYADLPWLEIILTLVGMLFCVAAICITIVQLTSNTKKDDNSDDSL